MPRGPVRCVQIPAGILNVSEMSGIQIIATQFLPQRARDDLRTTIRGPIERSRRLARHRNRNGFLSDGLVVHQRGCQDSGAADQK